MLLHTVGKRRHHLDALFLKQVYIGSKFCPPVLDTGLLRDPSRYIRAYSMFNVCSYRKIVFLLDASQLPMQSSRGLPPNRIRNKTTETRYEKTDARGIGGSRREEKTEVAAAARVYRIRAAMGTR
jgi:hypothetical protein